MRTQKLIGIILISFSLISNINALTFEKLLENFKKSKEIGKMGVMAVAGGDNLTMLKACRKARDLGIVDSLLVGDETKIKRISLENKIRIDDFNIIDIKDPYEMAKKCALLVKEGKADFYAKGSIQTRYFIKAILDKQEGLRTNKLVSAVTVMEMPDIKRLLLMTDPSVNINPTFTNKVEIINNAVEVSDGIGIHNPKVAILSAIEIVNPRMPETIEANELKKMNEEGKIKNCIIDGPISMDLAVDPNASVLKGIKGRKINGDADIVVFPDIHSANIAYKISIRLGRNKSGTLIVGTSVPVVYSSRSDTVENKFNSILLASSFTQFKQRKHQ